MALSTYLLYVAAVALLIVTPGPTMLMCMTNSINHGPRRAMTSVAGSVTAVMGVMLLSAMGLGALLAASETAFTLLRSSTLVRWINRVCGGLFTLMGGALLLTRRSA